MPTTDTAGELPKSAGSSSKGEALPSWISLARVVYAGSWGWDPTGRRLTPGPASPGVQEALGPSLLCAGLPSEMESACRGPPRILLQNGVLGVRGGRDWGLN